jgi:hypothetical protein
VVNTATKTRLKNHHHSSTRWLYLIALF